MKKLLLLLALITTRLCAQTPPPDGPPDGFADGGVTIHITGIGKEVRVDTVITGEALGGTVTQSDTNYASTAGYHTFMNGTSPVGGFYTSISMTYTVYERDIPAEGESKVGNSFLGTPGVSEPGTWTQIASGVVDKMEPVGDNPMIEVEGMTNAHAPTPDDQKSLWLVQGNFLSAEVFREGIDKVVFATNAATSVNPGGGTGGGDAMTKAEWDSTATEQIALSQGMALNQNPTSQAAADAGALAKASTETALGTRTIPAVGSVPATSPNDIFTIELPGTGRTLNLNPASNTRINMLGEFTRAAFAWIVYMMFQVFVWNFLKEIYMTLAGTVPAKGNAIVGGTGAQATSLIVALGITAVIVSLPTLFWAMADSGMTWAAGITTNPFQAASGNSILSAGLYLANFFLPLGTMLLAFSSYLFLLRGGIILAAGLQSIIRHIVA